jgi:hypothetical protein
MKMVSNYGYPSEWDIVASPALHHGSKTGVVSRQGCPPECGVAFSSALLAYDQVPPKFAMLGCELHGTHGFPDGLFTTSTPYPGVAVQLTAAAFT